MRSYSLPDRLVIIFGFILLFALTLACGSTTTEQLSEAAQPRVETATVSDAAPAVADVDEATPENTASRQGESISDVEVEEAAPTESGSTAPPPEPTAEPTVAPTATLEPAAQPAQLGGLGFGQDGRSVSYGFIITNPNPGIGLEDVGYQATGKDADGVIVATDSGSIPALFPGATIGIAGDIFVEENVQVESIDVQLSRGEAVPSEPIPNFSAETVTYIPDDYFSKVTGIIASPFSRQFDDVRVSAIAYDADDNIIGGGYTYVSFVPANGTTGVSVSVNVGGEVARAEIYPVVTFLSLFRDETVIPDDGFPVELLSDGFGQGEFSSSYGFEVRNPNETYAVEDSRYRVTVFGADDTVIDTDEGYAIWLLPGQTLGIGGDLSLAGDGAISRIETQFTPGDYVTNEELLPFTTSDAAFAPGSFSSDVNGVVTNPYSSEVTNLRVSALAFDEAGQIIGGGYTFLDFVPGGGSANVSVPIQLSVAPDSVELYASLSNLSDFVE